MDPTSEFRSTLHEWMALFMRRSMRDMVLHSRDLGVSMVQLGALFHIHKKHVCSVSDIGDDMGTTRAAASQMLNRLVQMGFVERTEDPDDRRAKRIVLSDEGLAMLRRSLHARMSWLDEVSEALSLQEREQVEAALKLLIARAYELDPSPHPRMSLRDEAFWADRPKAPDPEMKHCGESSNDHADRGDEANSIVGA